MKKITDSLKKTLFGLLRIDPIKDRADLIEVANQYAVTQAKRDVLTAQMDAELLAVRDRYALLIEQHDATLTSEFNRIREWGAKHRDAEFHGEQTLIIAGHELKFHKSPGAVKVTDGLTVDDVVQKILALPTLEDINDLPGHSMEELDANEALRDTLIRVTPDLDKNAVKREWRLSEDDSVRRMHLRSLSLDVVAEESFSFTPARVEIPSTTASTREAA